MHLARLRFQRLHGDLLPHGPPVPLPLSRASTAPVSTGSPSRRRVAAARGQGPGSGCVASPTRGDRQGTGDRQPLLLADEPTGDLDFRTGVQILEVPQSQADAGRTVIMVRHNRETSRITDQVIKLSGAPTRATVHRLGAIRSVHIRERGGCVGGSSQGVTVRRTPLSSMNRDRSEPISGRTAVRRRTLREVKHLWWGAATDCSAYGPPRRALVHNLRCAQWVSRLNVRHSAVGRHRGG